MEGTTSRAGRRLWGSCGVDPSPSAMPPACPDPRSPCGTPHAIMEAMSAAKAPMYLDEDLAREVADRAAKRGERPEQLVAEVLRRHFLLEVFERIWTRNRDDLSEEEALDLAYRELKAMRAERRAAGSA